VCRVCVCVCVCVKVCVCVCVCVVLLSGDYVIRKLSCISRRRSTEQVSRRRTLGAFQNIIPRTSDKNLAVTNTETFFVSFSVPCHLASCSKTFPLLWLPCLIHPHVVSSVPPALLGGSSPVSVLCSRGNSLRKC
jgi:hypothetical protein